MPLRLPSGRRELPQPWVSPVRGAYSEEETFDASAVTNVVKVHYDYDYVPPVVDPGRPRPQHHYVTVKYLEEGNGKSWAKEFSHRRAQIQSEVHVAGSRQEY